MKNLDLNLLAREIHDNAKSKGFWDSERNIGEIFMLIVSELGEALEAHRKNKFANWERFSSDEGGHAFEPEIERWASRFKRHVKDTVGDELADVVIRTLDFMAYKGYEAVRVSSGVKFANFGESLLWVTSMITDAWKEIGENPVGEAIQLNRVLSQVFAICEYHDIFLEGHISAKMKYNQTREKLHGKAY